MPLLKRKLFTDYYHPNVKIKPEQEVWQIQFTGEIFTDYLKYLERILSYKEHVWTCRLTGKMGLTFEEALASEKKAAAKNVTSLSDEYQRFIVDCVHFSTERLDTLVGKIAEKLKTHYSKGEMVQLKVNDVVRRVVILGIEKMENGEMKEEDGYVLVETPKIDSLLDESNYYRVRILEDNEEYDGEECNNVDKEIAIVPMEELSRKKTSWSKESIKRFVRDISIRDLAAGAPLIVHKELLQKFGIMKKVPEHLKAWADKQKEANEELEAKKVKIKEEEKAMVPPPVVKYPVEDLELEDRTSEQSNPLPRVAQEFVVTIPNIGNMLMVWKFLQVFGKSINLYPFSLDDFENALRHGDEAGNCALLYEIHAALLRPLMRYMMERGTEGGQNVSSQEKKTNNLLKSIGENNWEDALLLYFQKLANEGRFSDESNLIEAIKYHGYNDLKADQKVEILKILSDRLIDLKRFKDLIDESFEELSLVKKELRELQFELRKTKEFQLVEMNCSPNSEEETERSSIESDESGYDSDSNDTILNTNFENFENLSRTEKLKYHQRVKEEEEKWKLKDLQAQEKAKRKKAREEKLQDRLKVLEQEKNLQKKAEQLEKEYLQAQLGRTNPLGYDRDFNRFWFFDEVGSSLSMDAGRLFVQSKEDQWGYYSQSHEINAILSRLDIRGLRENILRKNILRNYDRIVAAINKRNQDHLVIARSEEARRSSRLRTSTRHLPYIQYVNKWSQV